MDPPTFHSPSKCIKAQCMHYGTVARLSDRGVYSIGILQDKTVVLIARFRGLKLDLYKARPYTCS